MTWQKKARLALVTIVVAFVGVVAFNLRQPKPEAPVPVAPERPEDAIAYIKGGLVYDHSKDGRIVFSVKAEGQATYKDGRTVYKNATLTLPERNGRTVSVRADEAEVAGKEGQTVGTALLKGDVTLTTSDGVHIKTGQATYNDTDGILEAEGPVEFSRGRMKGTGVGATYDRNREILWLLDQAHITVAPDANGEGALDATSGAAGLARGEHYARLTRNGRITSADRVIEADDITIQLTDDEQRVKMLELRGNSRITGTGGGTQSMSARDIDLTYAEDGRSLQSARLVDNAVVQLPGEKTGSGRRVSGRTIDMTMSPDGASVTSLNASENVQVDLPADAGGPARRIRSATLVATGAPGAGLQAATFNGNVDYRESKPAQRNAAAVERTARALKLVVQTKPGLGALQQADFRGNVHITDGPETVLDARRVIYRLAEDRMDLSPGEGDPGPESQVTDGRITVKARTIELALATRRMKADTDVRSTLLPQRSAAQAGGRGAGPAPPAEGRLPSMLRQDEPVNVTSNRLEYDGSASSAVYSGTARLWQGATNIQAATLILDDKNGNLTARDNVRTRMMMSEVDPRTKVRKETPTEGRAETFEYDDARRLATYTEKAHINGPQGDVTADKIELFLASKANELQRAEAYGTVTVKDALRTATGTRLTYTAADDQYVMTGAVGNPVVVIEKKPGSCAKTLGSRLTFRRAVDGVTMDEMQSKPCDGVRN
jgi:LPS export ABC transporter protein LptC/lipopolysaccharide transport protein LptA